MNYVEKIDKIVRPFNRKLFIGALVFVMAFGISITVLAVLTIRHLNRVNVAIPRETDRRLGSMRIVRQPPRSDLCGPASLMMVEQLFFGESGSMDEIYSQVIHSSGRGSGMDKMANYLEDRGLNVNLVNFTDYRALLYYLERNQIPAIMLLASVDRETGHDSSHFVVFLGYHPGRHFVSIMDPSRGRLGYFSYGILAEGLRRRGNWVIIMDDHVNNKQEYTCPYCGETRFIDTSILEFISFISCNHSPRTFSVSGIL
ncbi:MAG: C39 family peptidase [Treponema sp.]|nr:C39 family peptidase [Treponema sp.]